MSRKLSKVFATGYTEDGRNYRDIFFVQHEEGQDAAQVASRMPSLIQKYWPVMPKFSVESTLDYYPDDVRPNDLEKI